jgi:hypothetical protein
MRYSDVVVRTIGCVAIFTGVGNLMFSFKTGG